MSERTQEEIQQEIRSLESQLEYYKQAEPSNTAKQQELAGQIEALQAQEREQKAQEVNGTNSDIAVQIFDALHPNTKVFENILGLTEFGDYRTSFYQLLDMALAERTKLHSEQHAEEMAAKDEKIRLLQKQGQDLQAQLDVVVHELDEYIDHNHTLADDIAERNAQIAEYSVKLDAANRENDRLNQEIKVRDGILNASQEKIAELESKLEAVQKPKVEAQPSGSLQDKLDQIKKKNEISADDWIAKFNARQKNDAAKVQVPDISEVSQFRPEPAATEPSGGEFPAAEASEAVSQFQPSETGHDMAADPSNVQGEMGEAATKGWVKEQLAELERKLTGEQVA